jgi:Fe2+ transport system protein FeoA
MSEDSASTLNALALGETAKIAGFDLPAEHRARLFEMGLTVGAEVQLVRFAPMGDPIDIKVRGYHLSLRKREAAGIRVVRSCPG